jgi:hypothetical protein
MPYAIIPIGEGFRNKIAETLRNPFIRENFSEII